MSYVVKLQNGQIVRCTSYHLRHTSGQYFKEECEDNDDIILGVNGDKELASEDKFKDSQINEEVTKTKVGRVVKKPTKLNIYDLSN